MKCVKVEKATHELLDILLNGQAEEILMMEVASGRATPNTFRSQSKVSTLGTIEEMDELRPGEATLMREQHRRNELHTESKYLLSYFSHKMSDALLRCTKLTLESIKRRITSPSALLYGEAAEEKLKRDSRPAFRVKLTLSIPNVSIKPTLEEIQTAVNDTIQCVLGVHKGVFVWGQDREEQQKSSATSSQSQLAAPSVGRLAETSALLGKEAKTGTPQLTSFFKAVSEHKEIAKLVSLLSSVITSAKPLVNQSLEHFKHFEHLWAGDAEKEIAEFMKIKPELSEFEARIKEYEQLETAVIEGEEELVAGSLCLVTGNS